jgi:hypothetical protein
VAFWIALAVLVVGVVGGLAYAVLRGIALWRQVKRTGGSFNEEAARISERSAEIQVHLDRASAAQARLAEATGRLSLARARLDVLLQALREARHTVGRLLWFMPGA